MAMRTRDDDVTVIVNMGTTIDTCICLESDGTPLGRPPRMSIPDLASARREQSGSVVPMPGGLDAPADQAETAGEARGAGMPVGSAPWHDGTVRVLVADDQPDVRTALHLLMRDAGLESDAARSVDEVRVLLASGAYDLLLLDLNYSRDTTSGREGLALLDEVHALDPLLPVVVMTGWGSVEMAVEAMRRGARTFVHKPWDNAALADAIRREVADGRAARHAERRASRDHAEAQAIQHALLPASLPALPGCDLAAAWRPASAFGGDGYDVIALDGRRLALSIADVCGKGLAAALLMSNLQASVRAYASGDPAPAHVTAKVNDALVRNGGLRRFVTFFYAVYDAGSRALTYVNAGHCPPVVVGADGSVRRLATGGPVLGIFDAATFEQGTSTSRRAIGSCSSPTASSRPSGPTAKSSANAVSPRSRSRAAGPRPPRSSTPSSSRSPGSAWGRSRTTPRWSCSRSSDRGRSAWSLSPVRWRTTTVPRMDTTRAIPPAFAQTPSKSDILSPAVSGIPFDHSAGQQCLTSLVTPHS